MRSLRGVFPLALMTLLSMAGCETTQPKKTAPSLPAQANAPSVTSPVTPPQATDQRPKIHENLTPVPDPVEGLIASAEKQYEAGQANYQAGHLEAAKSNFDQAFNTLLSSNFDIRNDDRLEHEFDKVVEAVHELELVALRQGDGFTEQRSEPAPIDEANDVTFPVDPNVKAKAEAEVKVTKSDLPLVLNDQVAMFINYFSSPRGHGTIERGLARSGRYRDMITQILKEEGVPLDLTYLAQAESGFQPLALSRAGARGMWQFMAGSASPYGLERNWWVDDRQDPEKATRAAARYLKDLYNQFGDWYLAMAAYNSGAGTVQRAVERTGYADFWELYKRGVLPKETQNYVPIIVAVTIMAKNPTQYGLDHVVPEAPPQVDRVTINYPVDLRLVAECVDTSVNYLQELNPSLLRMTTPKDQSFTLLLPSGSNDKYQTAMAAVPQDMRTWWRYHRVEAGDTVALIARKYHTSPTSIEQANNLSDGDVKVGAKLIIPIAPGHQGGDATAYSKRATHYKVRKGDTQYSVAEDFEIPVEKLRKWNHLRGTTLSPGRTLVIYKPTSDSDAPEVVSSKKSAPTGKSHKTTTSNVTASAKYHKVKKGETLSSIAESYNTTVVALRRQNPKLTANLHAGAVLIIPQ